MVEVHDRSFVRSQTQISNDHDGMITPSSHCSVGAAQAGESEADWSTLEAVPRRQRTTPAVLFVSSYLSSAPLERYVSGDLAGRLSSTGWSVAVTSTKINRFARLLDMLVTVRRRAASYDLAVVDVFSGPAFFWAECVCWLLRRMGKPIMLALHGGSLPDFARRWPGRVRRLLRSAADVTTPSGYLKEELRCYHADIRLVRNPIELGRYSFVCRNHPKPDLVWLRAFCEIYNPSLGPRVVAALVGEFPAVSLAMIGPDKKDRSLQRTRATGAKLGVQRHLSFPGAVVKSDVPLALSEGDIFLNTTNVDSAPVSVLEAMACGLCIVSTNVGGIPYLVEDEKNGLLVPPNDAGAMAAAVRRVLTEQGLAQRLSRNARTKAEQHDWSVILPQWEQLLAEVALGSAGPPRPTLPR